MCSSRHDAQNSCEHSSACSLVAGTGMATDASLPRQVSTARAAPRVARTHSPVHNDELLALVTAQTNALCAHGVNAGALQAAAKRTDGELFKRVSITVPAASFEPAAIGLLCA